MDQGTFILHALLLALLTIVLFAYAVPNELYSVKENTKNRAQTIILYLILIADFLYQLCICYVCFKMS